jgi:hypothetical protein
MFRPAQRARQDYDPALPTYNVDIRTQLDVPHIITISPIHRGDSEVEDDLILADIASVIKHQIRLAVRNYNGWSFDHTNRRIKGVLQLIKEFYVL